MNNERTALYALACDGPLAADTINRLSAYTINRLSADTINGLSADTINRLSADTISRLSAYRAHLDALPVLDKPYTRMLEGINSGQRKHSQSTFGPEDCNAETNICGTAMCTAGHLVNMAGAAGYAMKQEYGWVVAATAVHYKAHPNLPVQNFGDIPQDHAMAYIEHMAEIEGQAK